MLDNSQNKRTSQKQVTLQYVIHLSWLLPHSHETIIYTTDIWRLITCNVPAFFHVIFKFLPSSLSWTINKLHTLISSRLVFNNHLQHSQGQKTKTHILSKEPYNIFKRFRISIWYTLHKERTSSNSVKLINQKCLS